MSEAAASKAPPSAPTGPRSLRFPPVSSPRFHRPPHIRPHQRPYYHAALRHDRGLWNRLPSGPRAATQMNRPTVHSPLQQSFPAYTDSRSEPSPPPTQETMARRSRLAQPTGRPRGESRSSSVPNVVRTSQRVSEETEASNLRAEAPLRPQGHPSSRAFSPLPRSEGGQNRRSVKHLTCFWWWEKGECRFSEEDCLYSHCDTGHYTAAPRQVNPGEPAKAGKSLERALTKLAITNRSSASLPSLSNNHHHSHNNSHALSSAADSRPVTPFVEPSRASTPSPLYNTESISVFKLKSENEFFRSLVDQAQHEKRTLIDTIESLQLDKTSLVMKLDEMNGERSSLIAERNNLLEERSTLLAEREILQATIKKLQFGSSQSSSQGLPVRSPSLTFPTHNPWGTIGSRRTSAMTADSQTMQQPLGTSGGSGAFSQSVNRPSSSLNASAAPYSRVNADLDHDLSSIGNGSGVEGEKLRNVLRNLGPGF